MTKLGRNDPCHCGSGKKYKRCHLAADEREHIDNCLPASDEDSPTAFLNMDKLPERLRQLSAPGLAADGEMIAEPADGRSFAGRDFACGGETWPLSAGAGAAHPSARAGGGGALSRWVPGAAVGDGTHRH